jgi:hypothetical protein
MSNKNNNLITFGVLAILFSVVSLVPNITNAYTTQAGYTIYDYGYSATASGNGSNPTNSTSGVTPSIRATTPKSAELNSGANTITINGSGFNNESVAKFDGQDRPTTYVNSNRLLMDLYPNDMKTPGKHLITVLNPNGKYSNNTFFDVTNNGVNGGYTTSAGSTSSGTVAKATTKPATAFTGGNLANLNSVNSTNSKNSTDSSLSANVASSGFSFMPNTFLEWLFLSIMILLGVILFRKLWVTEADKHTPLKHA